MIDSQTKLIAIVGPTASGKTDLALRLAERFNGEIICADSRTVYRRMDIGTAKPAPEEQDRVPHHMLDLVDPDQRFTAQEFKVKAERIIAEVVARGRVPFLVGGTGLYVYAVVYDFQFPAGPRTVEREELERQPLEDLVARLWQEDPDRAAEIDLHNPRRVIRALETVGQPRERTMQLPPNRLILGLRPPEDVLNKRIIQRTDRMFRAGLVGEVRRLWEQYGEDTEALKSPGYAEVMEYLQGKVSLADAQKLVELHTRQLVRRQLTWFKRNPEIKWLEQAEQADLLVEAFLSPSRTETKAD